MGVKLPHNPTIPKGLKAEDLIIKTINESKTKIDILSIGAPANVALALEKDPNIKDKINSIYIMGGALKVPGNIFFFKKGLSKFAEINIYSDPCAADKVISSGIPIFLVPLDICNKIPVDPIFFKQLKKNIKTPQTELVYKILYKAKKYIDNNEYFFI